MACTITAPPKLRNLRVRISFYVFFKVSFFHAGLAPFHWYNTIIPNNINRGFIRLTARGYAPWFCNHQLWEPQPGTTKVSWWWKKLRHHQWWMDYQSHPNIWLVCGAIQDRRLLGMRNSWNALVILYSRRKCKLLPKSVSIVKLCEP